MAKAKIEVDKERVETLKTNHQWRACLAICEALGADAGVPQGLNWGKLCEAAYHAGAARALYDATF